MLTKKLFLCIGKIIFMQMKNNFDVDENNE